MLSNIFMTPEDMIAFIYEFFEYHQNDNRFKARFISRLHRTEFINEHWDIIDYMNEKGYLLYMNDSAIDYSPCAIWTSHSFYGDNFELLKQIAAL